MPLHEQAKAEDPSFKTPEEIAAEEHTEAAPAVAAHQAGKAPWWQRWVPHTKKMRIIAGVIAVVLAFGIGATWTLTHHKRAVVADTTPKKVVTKPKPTLYSMLTGMPIADASLNQKPVTAVMVENSVDARPQSGLLDAGIVYEAVAEGGVTRFMALYQDTAPANVGPIRSARPYYIQWAMGYDAAYAHVGGSPDALSDITAWGVKDLNQFSNGNSYHRISSRPAPHNVYTGIDTLNQLETAKGYGASTYTGFARKSDQPYKTPAATTGKKSASADTRTPATGISMSLSGYTYDPHFDYDAATNSYNRSEAGKPHVDAESGKQLSPKVVVAIVVPMSQGALDSSGAYYSDYNTIGSGQAFIFQDGTVTTATWNKPSNDASLTLTDARGAAVPLNRGQTWITAITAPNKVSY